MAYYTTGITNIRFSDYDYNPILKATTTHTDKYIQCYVSGDLVGYELPDNGEVSFVLSHVTNLDLLLLVAVDKENATTNYWDDACSETSTYGNRIKVQTPQTIAPYLPDDIWTVYRGDAGDSEATTKIHEQDFYPNRSRDGGYGKYYGSGGYGWDGYECEGYGSNYGYGEYGYDCKMLTFKTDPMYSGTYPIKITVTDVHGNASTATETTITIDTYARPASDLTVESYDKNTDALEFSFTASEDLA